MFKIQKTETVERCECRGDISLETCYILFYFSMLLDSIWAWLLVQQQILQMYYFFRKQLFELQYLYYFGCQESCWEASQTELLMKINSCLIETLYLKGHLIKKVFNRETGHKHCCCSSGKYFVLFCKGRKCYSP